MSTRIAELETLSRRHETPRVVSAIEGYQCWAPTYDRDFNPLLHREERYLMTFLPAFAGKRVLDLACGTGRWLQKCVDLKFKTSVGVDISQSMLKMASQKAGLKERVALADCMALPFCECNFDLVICSFAVWHVSNLELMAIELARVTKPHGTVFLSDLHPEAHARGWRTGFRDGDVPKHILTSPLAVAEVIQSFRAAGLDCVKFEALWLGEPEASIFSRAGKSELFRAASRLPAIAAFQFQRIGNGEIAWGTV